MHLCKVAGRQHRSILLKLVKYLHSHAKCFTNIQPLRFNNLNAFSLIETPGLTITMNAYTHLIKKNLKIELCLTLCSDFLLLKTCIDYIHKNLVQKKKINSKYFTYQHQIKKRVYKIYTCHMVLLPNKLDKYLKPSLNDLDR